MCTRYVAPETAAIERFWHVGRHNPWRGGEMFPRSLGPFLRADRNSTEPQCEQAIGVFGLVPWFAKSPKLTFATHNARFEGIANKASFKQSWQRGQRCIVPAWSFMEPNWETGTNVWWRIARADGEPLGLAGLWNTWVDRTSGEVVESYTMLTVNADNHPLMSRMHKPDPKLPPDAQDKRSVVVLERADCERWLYGTTADAATLVRAPDAALLEAGPLGVQSGGEGVAQETDANSMSEAPSRRL